MDVTHNEDGTVKVRIPKAPEEYDEPSGGLFISETLSKADYAKAVATKAPARSRSPKAKAKSSTTSSSNS